MSVRRVCIHTDRDGDPVSVDVTLPAGTPVGEFMPALVDMVDGRVTPGTWRLDRLADGVLDESLSLVDNGIHDGELLTLSRAPAPPLGVVRMQPRQLVAEGEPSTGILDRTLPGVLCLLATILASAMLASTAGSAHATTNVILAAVGACATAASTRANGYPTSSNVAVVSLAAATGFLAVPSTPATPNVFLAAMAGFSASLLTLRLSGRASPALIGIVALSLLTALVTVVEMPVVVVGAALSTASLALLALAPRLAVLTAKFDRDDVGHPTLSGLVAGAAAGSAAGAALVAATITLGAIAFTGLIAAVLLLRARTYVDAPRQIALLTAGLTSVATCLWTVCHQFPGYLGLAGGVLVGIGFAATKSPRIGASTARVLGALEYTAQAVVVPVACWIGGVYAHVGQFHLP